MKQGTSVTSMGGRKVEPTSKAVNVAKVSEIGVHQYRTKKIDLYEGRGFEAPKASATTHHRGSQGKH